MFVNYAKYSISLHWLRMVRSRMRYLYPSVENSFHALYNTASRTLINKVAPINLRSPSICSRILLLLVHVSTYVYQSKPPKHEKKQRWDLLGSGWKLETTGDPWGLPPTDPLAVLNWAPHPEVREKISEQETEDYEVFAGAYPGPTRPPDQLLTIDTLTCTVTHVWHVWGWSQSIWLYISRWESDQNRPPNMIKGFPGFPKNMLRYEFAICA